MSTKPARATSRLVPGSRPCSKRTTARADSSHHPPAAADSLRPRRHESPRIQDPRAGQASPWRGQRADHPPLRIVGQTRQSGGVEAEARVGRPTPPPRTLTELESAAVLRACFLTRARPSPYCEQRPLARRVHQVESKGRAPRPSVRFSHHFSSVSSSCPRSSAGGDGPVPAQTEPMARSSVKVRPRFTAAPDHP